MKILTWNINGIRSNKRCLKDVLDSLDADIISLQETKITRDMLDEPTAIVEGYNAYFSFSRKRSGYSGTANFCRDAVTPTAAEEGLSGQLVSQSEGSIGCPGNVAEFKSEELLSLDSEGRAVITQHEIELDGGVTGSLVIINVYVPRATERDDRWTYKQRFLALLQSRAESLLRDGRHVIILGDINTTHKRLDHCDPSTVEFLRIDSRQWIDQLLRPEDRDPDLAPIADRASFEGILPDTEGSHFIDTFRFFHPEETEAYTNWSTVTSARETNYGKRLDYIFADTGLQDYLVDCYLLPDVEGSDHCPVVLDLRCRPIPAKKCPSLCTKLMPEFQGKQQKLLSFFSKSSRTRPAEGTGKVTGDAEKSNDLETDLCQNLEAGEKNETSSSQSSAGVPSPPSTPSSTSSQLDRKAVQGEPSPQKGSLKRMSSHEASNSLPKKKKIGKGDNTSSAQSKSGKQSSLLSFFQKPQSSAVSSDCVKEGGSISAVSSDCVMEGGSTSAVSSDCVKEGGSTSAVSSDCVKEGGSKDAASDHRQRDGGGDMQSSSKMKSSPRKDSPNKTETPASSPSKFSLPSPTLIPSTSRPSDWTSSTPEGSKLSVDKESESLRERFAGGGDKDPRKTVTEDCSASAGKPRASCLWKGLLSGPPPPPVCKGHKEPCVLRTVKKAGPNRGKQFYVCARPEGHSTNKEARCDHFQWITYSSAGSGRKT